VQEVEELSREARQQANRSLRYYYDEDGSLVLKGRLPAEAGALLLKALESALPKRKPDRQDLSAETFAARRADALAQIAESFLKHGTKALNGGERHHIVVHVDEETLRERTAGRCELEEGPSIAAETARRLSCDASVIRVVENAQGQPLDVGRKTRSIPPALRRALNARDRGCRFPGCSNQRYVDAHHIRHWADGGETSARNLVTLCRFHHRQVHEGRVVVQALDDGALRFARPDGEVFESPAPGAPSHWRQLAATHGERGIHIEHDTAVTLWRGEQMDYGLAIETLLGQAKRSRNVSAETPRED
jgi:hypothetical protein